MTEVGMWALAAIFFAIVCVIAWFFLKLFCRFLLLVIAVSFFLAFLDHFSLLPESVSKHVEEVILTIKKKLAKRSEKKTELPGTSAE